MVRRLIINADGFGFGGGATRGIFDALASGGPITSVSVNANFPDARRTSELVVGYPAVSIGVHLNAVVGEPLLGRKSVPTLVGEDGTFPGPRFKRLWRKGKIDPRELEAEFDAQIGLVKAIAGPRLTHLDSHQNSHLLYFDLFIRLAMKWSIPCIRTNASLICLEAPLPARARRRVYLRRPAVWLVHAYRRFQMRRAAAAGLRMADRLVTIGYAGLGNKACRETWISVFQNLPQGTFEIYCHPAHPDEVLAKWASYVQPRAEELRILSDPALRSAASKSGVELIGFADLLDGGGRSTAGVRREVT